jgi:hypothetical protein
MQKITPRRDVSFEEQGSTEIHAKLKKGQKFQRRAYYIAVHLVDRADGFPQGISVLPFLVIRSRGTVLLLLFAS